MPTEDVLLLLLLLLGLGDRASEGVVINSSPGERNSRLIVGLRLEGDVVVVVVVVVVEGVVGELLLGEGDVKLGDVDAGLGLSHVSAVTHVPAVSHSPLAVLQASSIVHVAPSGLST